MAAWTSRSARTEALAPPLTHRQRRARGALLSVRPTSLPGSPSPGDDLARYAATSTSLTAPLSR